MVPFELPLAWYSWVVVWLLGSVESAANIININAVCGGSTQAPFPIASWLQHSYGCLTGAGVPWIGLALGHLLLAVPLLKHPVLNSAEFVC